MRLLDRIRAWFQRKPRRITIEERPVDKQVLRSMIVSFPVDATPEELEDFKRRWNEITRADAKE